MYDLNRIFWLSHKQEGRDIELKCYQLTSFQGQFFVDGKNRPCFKTNNIIFRVRGCFDKKSIGKIVEVKGLPVYGLESQNDLYIDSFTVVKE